MLILNGIEQIHSVEFIVTLVTKNLIITSDCKIAQIKPWFFKHHSPHMSQI